RRGARLARGALDSDGRADAGLDRLRPPRGGAGGGGGAPRTARGGGGLFPAHRSEGVADEIWRHRAEFLAAGRPRPQRLTATVLFVDLRGYTAHAEKMEPERLMHWSNE